MIGDVIILLASTHPDRRRQDAGAPRSAFTLLELLTVIAIIGILAAITLPVLDNFRPDPAASAARQLMDDLSRARQMAITHRTTVYMVFVPSNFWNEATALQGWRNVSDLRTNDFAAATNLYDKQWVGYNFVTLRSLGDQPGRPIARYLSNWRTLPEGAFIAPHKFLRLRTSLTSPPALEILTNNLPAFTSFGFNVTNNIPFPMEDTPPGPNGRWVNLPYIAFNYMGQLETGRNELIPLGKGTVTFQRDRAAGTGIRALPSVTELPAGSMTNSSYTVVNIDWLTGRARLLRQEVR